MFDIGRHIYLFLLLLILRFEFTEKVLFRRGNFLLPHLLYTGHEDDYVIELANEVRKVLGVIEIENTKEIISQSSSYISVKSLGFPISWPLPESVVADS